MKSFPTLDELRAEKRRRDRNKIARYFHDDGPFRRELYPKHVEFFRAGREHRERCFMAGNRVGKTDSGAYEVTCHLTGRYPAWWDGRKFHHPISAWACGDTNTTVRDILQAALLGKIVREPGDKPDQAIGLGTGMIPGDLIVTTRPRMGIPNAVEIAFIKHLSGGISTLTFKSYESGRKFFQGTSQEVVWCDEEPPVDVYDEALMRTMCTGAFLGGILLLTFTPLSGWTEVVDRFMNEEKRIEGRRFVVQAGWDDAPHLSEAEKEDLYNRLPPHQRDARSKGIPTLGAGAIYPVDESKLLVDPFEIPKHWRRAYGMDVGWNWTAAIWGAHDLDNDRLYLYEEYLRSEGEPSLHAAAVTKCGSWIPGVIDPAANGRSPVDGRRLLEMYRALGLDIETADNSVEAGIYEVWTRMVSGRLKVFKSLGNWHREFRKYHRDDKGRIVKSDDHLMDAKRYLVMSGLSRAKCQPVPPQRRRSSMAAPGSWMA